MEWQRFPICCELLSPVHVGFLPNNPGTVIAPTRLYVPGKNLWGAITASLTPRLYPAPTPRDFTAVGESVRGALSFSYLYLSDGEKIFTPSYEAGNLQWGGDVDQEFRAAFVDSRLSTQIGVTGAAEDGSLHEIEFIRHRIGSPTTGIRPVFLCGAGWLRGEIAIGGLPLQLEAEIPVLRRGDSERGAICLLRDLAVGGERNYGFGRLRPAPVSPLIRQKLEHLWPEEPHTPFALNQPLLGHAPYRPDLRFQGLVEMLASRQYPNDGRLPRSYEAPGAAVTNDGYFFAPGTHVSAAKLQARIDNFGQIVWSHPPS